MKLKLTPKQLSGLLDTLLGAFNLTEMETVLDRCRRLTLEDVSHTGTREEKFRDLIRMAERQDWLPDLVAEAREAHPADLESIAAEIEIMARAAPVVTSIHQELMDLLHRHKVAEAVIIAAYRFSAPEDWQYDIDRLPLRDTAAAAVYRLAETRKGKTSYPLLAFAELIRTKIIDEKPSEAQLLYDWMERVFDLTQTEQALRAVIRGRRPRTPLKEQPLYLQITVAPVKESRPPVCTVSASRLLIGPDGAKDYVKLAGSEAKRSSSELPAVISRFIAQLDPEREETGNLTVEIFLPRHLLGLCVDQWPTDQEVPRPIGSDCDVVLRSWERSYEPHYAQRVRRPWVTLWKRHSDPEQQRALVWKASFDLKLYPNILDNLDEKTQKKASCVIVNVVPGEEAYIQKGLIETVIAAGTPVAVWPRQKVDAPKASFRKLLRDLKMDPAAWRERVTTARIAGASVSEDHFGRHLCLLWDDPNRVPPREGLGGT